MGIVGGSSRVKEVVGLGSMFLWVVVEVFWMVLLVCG